jgi:hypothetical protein
MSAPPQSVEQRQAALTAALAARRARADLRSRLKAGELTGSAVIAGSDADPRWAALRVSWLLESLPGVGPVRAERLMADVGIAASRRLRGLGERQRADLLAALAGR